MAHDHVQGRRILLDTCCLINLYASAHIEDIIATVPLPFGVAEAVRREALYILPESEPAEPLTEAEPVSIEPLVVSGLLEVLQPESEKEAGSYIDFAADLDDGEAMTCALAVHRSYDIATDERKAIRILAERAPQVVVHTTSGLVRWWAEVGHVDPQIVRRTLNAIQVRGRFRPGKTDPLLSWWESVLR